MNCVKKHYKIIKKKQPADQKIRTKYYSDDGAVYRGKIGQIY